MDRTKKNYQTINMFLIHYIYNISKVYPSMSMLRSRAHLNSCVRLLFWNFYGYQGSQGNQKQSRWPLSTFLTVNGLRHASGPVLSTQTVK